jgi:hypothetical protein
MSSNPAERVEQVRFSVHKFTARPRPEDTSKVRVVCCFSEFGCETLGVTYVFDRYLANNPAEYVVVVGWYGREYLYRHLADEFWEVNEEHMWLRDFCKAFHHESKNLARLEKALGAFGSVVKSSEVGHWAVAHLCRSCRKIWGKAETPTQCPFCHSPDVEASMLNDVNYWKPKARPLPRPSGAKLAEARKYLGPNPVAVCARGRATYGRNLPPEFYVRLVSLLERRGYTPVWIGERQSSQACPVGHVVDLSRRPEARDLELTLAVVSQCRFTVQFWTASSRLAGMMGVPYLLFESPDQVWGQGQEGCGWN